MFPQNVNISPSKEQLNARALENLFSHVECKRCPGHKLSLDAPLSRMQFLLHQQGLNVIIQPGFWLPQLQLDSQSEFTP